MCVSAGRHEKEGLRNREEHLAFAGTDTERAGRWPLALHGPLGRCAYNGPALHYNGQHYNGPPTTRSRGQRQGHDARGNADGNVNTLRSFVLNSYLDPSSLYSNAMWIVVGSGLRGGGVHPSAMASFVMRHDSMFMIRF